MKLLKKLIVVLLFVGTIFSANAQASWGIKGSYIFNSNGELVQETEENVSNIINGNGGSGFNVGLYGELDLVVVYLRSELLYSQSSSDYEIQGANSDFKMSSMDLPVLVGVKLGPLKLFAGPSFRYIINSEMEDLNYEDINSDITVGVNAGIAFQLGRLGIDFTYNGSFSNNQAEFIDDSTNGSYTLDTRPQQFNIGLSYRMSHKK
jgi:hypothetical protein